MARRWAHKARLSCRHFAQKTRCPPPPAQKSRQFRDALAWPRHPKTPVTCPAVACPAAPRPAALAGQGTPGQAGRREDRGPVRQHLSVRSSWSAPTARSMTPPGRSRRPAWKTWPRGSARKSPVQGRCLRRPLGDEKRLRPLPDIPGTPTVPPGRACFVRCYDDGVRVVGRQPPGAARSTWRRRSGSEIPWISAILPSLTVKPIAPMSRPCGAMARPAVPFTSAGWTNRACRE